VEATTEITEWCARATTRQQYSCEGPFSRFEFGADKEEVKVYEFTATAEE
jgi:hypothetical protein